MCRLCGGGFKIFEGKEILKNNFSWAGKVEALLQTLVCGLACSGLQMCLHLWVAIIQIFSDKLIQVHKSHQPQFL